MNYSLYIHFMPFTHDEQGWKLSQQQEYDLMVEPGLSKIIEYLRRKPEARMSYADLSHIAIGSRKKPQLEFSLNKVIKSQQLELATSGWTQTYWASSYYTDFLSNMGYGRRYLNKTFEHAPKSLLDVDQQGITLTALGLLKQAGIDNLVFGRFGANFLEKYSQPGVQQPVLRIQTPQNTTVNMVLVSENLEPNPNTRLPTWLGTSNILEESFDLHSRVGSDLDGLLRLRQSSRTQGLGFHKESGGLLIPRVVGGRYAFYSPDLDYRHIDLYVIFVQSNNLSGRLAGVAYACVSTVSDFFLHLSVPDVTAVDSSPTHVTLKEGSAQEPIVRIVTGGFVTGSFYKKSARSFSQLIMCLKNLMSMYLLRFPDVFGFDLDGILDRIAGFHQWTAMSQHHKLFGGHTTCAVTLNKLSELETQLNDVKLIWKQFLSRFVKPANKFVNADLLEYRIVWPRGEIPQLETGTYLLINGERKTPFQLQLVSGLRRLNLRSLDSINASKVFTTCWENTVCEHVITLYNLEPYQSIPLYIDPVTEEIPSDTWVDLQMNDIPMELSLFSLRRYHQNSTLGWVSEYSIKYEVPHRFINVEYELCKYEWNGDGPKPTGETLASNTNYTCIKPELVRFQIQGESIAIQSTYEGGFCTLELKHIPDSPIYASLMMRITCKRPESPRKSDRDYVVKYRTSVQNSDMRIATDSNGLITEHHTGQKVGSGGPLAGFSPITKFAFVEDPQTRFSVVVDRAKAVRTKDLELGTVEIMFFRVYRPLIDGSTCSENNPISITHYLNFEQLRPQDQTNDAKELLHRQLQLNLDSTPLIVSLTNFSVNEVLITQFGNPRILEYPSKFVRVELDVMRAGIVMLRLHNLHETKGTLVNIDDFLANRFKAFYSEIIEYTVDFFAPLESGLNWKYGDRSPPTFVLSPMSARTFMIVTY